MRKPKTSRTKSNAKRTAARVARRKKRVARRSTKRGQLPRPTVRADDSTLTRFAGLIPLILFMTENLQIPDLLKKVVGYRGRRRVHQPHLVLFAFIVASLAGVARLAHLDWLRDDIALVKYLRLTYWPVRKVFSGALAMVSTSDVLLLEEFIGELGFSTIRGASSAVLDFDPTALVDHGEAEGGKFGHCGKGRNRRRHFPLVASIAETRTVIMAKYRDGSGLKAHEMIEFIEATVARAVKYLGSSCQLFLRADCEFWSLEMGRWLNANNLAFVMAAPMAPGIKLFLHQAEFQTLTDDEDIQFTAFNGKQVGFGEGVRIVVVRRRVHDSGAPPLGKKVKGFSQWRHQAIVTNQDWDPVDVWRFYNGRADCERVFRIGKQTLALGHLVGRSFRANEVAFLLRLLAFNADTCFQLHCEAQARTESRPVRRLGLEWRQFRFFNSPGRLLRVSTGYLLRVPANDLLAELWAFYDSNGPSPASGVLTT